jgi:ABC-2 type transport system permease protein
MPIFDQGYQRWSGELSGHAWRWLAITRHGVRIGMKGRWLRFAIMFSWLPAVGLAFMLCIWGLAERKSDLVTPVMNLLQGLGLLDARIVADPRRYRVEVWTLCYDYFMLTELRFSMVLVLLVGPSLISQDLRFNALPLYLSRPLRRIDYFVGKLGVIAAFLGMVVIVPAVLAYGLGLLFSLDLTIVPDTFRLLVAAIAYGLVISLSAGLLILALSSLSRNSRYIALFWVGVWFVSSIVGVVLESVNRVQRLQVALNKADVSQPVRPPDQGPPMPEERDNDRRTAPAPAPRGLDWEEFEEAEFRAAKTNWAPLLSYTANLSRVGQEFLGTNGCWERLSELRPEKDRRRFLLNNAGPQYPWYWSAAVLTGIFGLSVCILNFRVKSLDRLR